MLFRQIILCTFVLSVAASAGADDRMSAEEMQRLFADSTQIGTTKRGSSGPLTYWLYKRADGTSTYHLQDGWSDKGTWRISDKGESCTTFEKIRKGKERCSAIYRTGDKYKAVRPAGSTNTFEIVSGNPKNL